MNRPITIILIGLFICFTSQAQTYFGQQNIISGGVDGSWCAYAADLDGDGDIDVLTGFFYDNHIIEWHENIDGNGNFGTQHIITSSAGRVGSLFTIDIDGDGDIDVLSTTGCQGEILWYENIDGNGNFGFKQVVATELNGAGSVYAADIDGDDDMDVLSSSAYDDMLLWFENTDGNGDFWEQIIISNTVDHPGSVYTSDVDNDGNMDVLAIAYWGDQVIWHENTNGGGDFGELQVISDSVDSPKSVYAADLDNDGDVDVLSASYNDNKIAWYDNIDGNGNFGEQQIISTSVTSATSVYAADFDNDGDMDVLAAAGNGDSIIWFENTDGSGNFGTQKIITTLTDFPTDVYAFDLNGDGDMDVLSVSNNDEKIAWYENFTLEILAHPQSLEICPNYSTSFTVMAKDASNYQWQVNEGNGFADLINNTIYSGVTTDTLQITTASITMSGFQYRCVLSNQGGSINTNEATLTVEDFENPVISSIHNNQSLDLNDNCEASLPDYTLDVIASDNCDSNLDITQTPNAGTSISGLTNTVTLMVTDDAENSASVSFNVEVMDNTAPVITSTHNNQSLILNDNCEASLPDYTLDVIANDNCDSNLDIIQTPIGGTSISGLTNTVTLTVTDDADNSASISFNVEVLDNTAPNLICIENITIELEEGQGTYIVNGNEFNPVIIEDNCSIESFSNNINNSETLDSEKLSFGTTTIIWTARDKSNNQSECSFDITINFYRGIHIYPNPTKGIVFFEFSRSDVEKIKIFDMNGKSIFEKKVIKQNENVDFFPLSTGLYFIQILTNSEVFTYKVVKKK
ncbi:MAG: FG-GAP-like repeat-containing protein [Bacteroidales bacterium]|nr:FG-GAP-like repeat-containing protein [Bacteroidales bacterium]